MFPLLTSCCTTQLSCSAQRDCRVVDIQIWVPMFRLLARQKLANHSAVRPWTQINFAFNIRDPTNRLPSSRSIVTLSFSSQVTTRKWRQNLASTSRGSRMRPSLPSSPYSRPSSSSNDVSLRLNIPFPCVSKTLAILEGATVNERVNTAKIEVLCTSRCVS